MNSQRLRRTRLIVPAFLLAVACLIGVSVLSYDNTRALRDAGNWVARTQGVRFEIEGVSSAMAGVQAAKLRYLLSGDEHHLESYDVSRAAVESRLDKVEALVGDNPDQQRRIVLLRAQVEAALSAARRAIARRRAGPFAPATVDSGARGTMRQMAEINQTIGAMDGEEVRLLADRTSIADATADRSLVTLAGLSIVTVGLLLSAYFAAHAEGRRRLRAQAEARAANAMLTTRVAELEWRTREVTALNDVSELLQLCLTPAQAYLALGQFVQRLVRSSSGFVAVIRDSRNVAECVVMWGEVTGEPTFAPDECCALRAGRLIDAPPGEAIIRCTHAVVDRATSGRTVCIPLLAHGETIGVLHVHIPHEASPLTTSEYSTTALSIGDPVRLLAQVSEHSAVALANLRLRERLQYQSIRDPLTGAFNRRYFEASLEREVGRARRSGRSAGLLMLDVDHFKQLNDRFGHDAGDTVLCELSAVLHRAVREEDIVCRYGGEEFAILVPEASLDVVRERAESIVAMIRKVDIDQHGQQVGSISASVGVAMFPAHADHPRDLIRMADSALYRAKALGRDRVEVAPELVGRREREVEV